MKRHAFTLIELLMTVAIVVILAGILVPAVMSGIKKGQQAKAKAEIVTLLNAIKQYENTYNKLPLTRYIDPEHPDEEKYYKADNTSKAQFVSSWLIQALQADTSIKNAAGNSVNPRKIQFLEKRNTGEGDYDDPWGNEYKIIFRADEEIPLTALYSANTTGGKIYQSVVIWSAGPDGDFDTKDDVHSFESEYEAAQWHVTN